MYKLSATYIVILVVPTYNMDIIASHHTVGVNGVDEPNKIADLFKEHFKVDPLLRLSGVEVLYAGGRCRSCYQKYAES